MQYFLFILCTIFTVARSILKRYELASSEVVKVVGNLSVSSRMASSKSASARGFVLSSSGRLGGSEGSTGGPVEGGLTLYEANMGL